MQILCGHICFCIFALFLQEISGTPAIRAASMRGIVFPSENWDDCIVDEASQEPGSCKTLDDCPDVLKKWQHENIYPKTCYFIKKEQHVCCPNSKQVMGMIESATTAADNAATSPNPTPMPTISIITTTSSTKREPTILELLSEIQRKSELECELNQRAESTIVHGTPANPDEFPFMAALGWTSNLGDSVWYRCGGAVISPKFVITAAHCAEIGSVSPDVVRIGGSNLTDPFIRDAKIKRFIKHPEYSDSSVYNDIALVELEEEAADIYAACLWTSDELSSNNVTAVGYGHTQFGGLASDQLLKATLSVVSKKSCGQFYSPGDDVVPNGLADAHLCAGDPEGLRDTCQGDSGGPLILEIRNGRFKTSYVVGVTSFGLGCAGEPPSIYTRVSAYIDWIESIVWPKFDTRFSKT